MILAATQAGIGLSEIPVSTLGHGTEPSDRGEIHAAAGMIKRDAVIPAVDRISISGGRPAIAEWRQCDGVGRPIARG